MHLRLRGNDGSLLACISFIFLFEATNLGYREGWDVLASFLEDLRLRQIVHPVV